jgi:G3E family GTPase
MHLFPSLDIGPFGRRQRHVRGARIPVTIVRGSAPREDGTAVVVDTFGADDVAPITACRCCTVRVRLQAALRERSGETRARIIIATDNDLAPILRTFASERALASDYDVEDAPPLDGERFMLRDDAPLSWDAFSRFMATLMNLRGADLTHVKGLLNVAGCRGPVAVAFLNHLAHRPVELQDWPDEDRASRLAFVTRGIDESAVRGMFDAVRTLSTSS